LQFARLLVCTPLQRPPMTTMLKYCTERLFGYGFHWICKILAPY
jgi:hypothetical protein